MATCTTCRTHIPFGGKRVGEHRFCNAYCRDNGKQIVENMERISEDELIANVISIHQGQCPECNGKGPVDIHESSFAFSLLLFTSWDTVDAFACQNCATKIQRLHLITTSLMGWWGIPIGPIITPFQIAANIRRLSGNKTPNRDEPSNKMIEVIKYRMATNSLHLDRLNDDELEAPEINDGHGFEF